MIIPKTRTIAGVVVAAVLVDIAMFFERYFIVVTGLRVPLMPYEPADYVPSLVEWSIFAGGVAFFALVTTLALKLFPMLAVWEMVEEHEHQIAVDMGEELMHGEALATTAPDEIVGEEP
jgi:molybdopterin-containing oxidoreductase family membrane subunit